MRAPDWEDWRGRCGSSSDARTGAVTRMKRSISIALCLLVACSVVLGQLAAAGADGDQEKKTSNAKPDAGGIVMEPSSGKIAEGDTITITFPLGMVAADLIDVGDQASPFVSEP